MEARPNRRDRRRITPYTAGQGTQVAATIMQDYLNPPLQVVAGLVVLSPSLTGAIFDGLADNVVVEGNTVIQTDKFAFYDAGTGEWVRSTSIEVGVGGALIVNFPGGVSPGRAMYLLERIPELETVIGCILGPQPSIM